MSRNVRKVYTFGSYCLVLDSREIVPDNPGEGTPALVETRDGRGCSTYWLCVDEGIIDHSDEGDRDLPESVYNWLVSMQDIVDKFIEDGP